MSNPPKAIEDGILSRTYGNGRGRIFPQGDFGDPGRRSAVDFSLHRSEKAGRIRRANRGIHDYPRHSEVPKKAVAPDIDQAAHALARKFAWRIQSGGVTARNLPRG